MIDLKIAIKKSDLEWLVTETSLLEDVKNYSMVFAEDVMLLTPSGARELAASLIANADIAEGKERKVSIGTREVREP